MIITIIHKFMVTKNNYQKIYDTVLYKNRLN